MKNILISDANHGGLTLLEEYSKYTNNNLFFYDTYNKLNLNMKEFYKKKYNVEFLSLDDIRKNEDKYITISPIHMKPLFRWVNIVKCQKYCNSFFIFILHIWIMIPLFWRNYTITC